jgi:hypothetical protein
MRRIVSPLSWLISATVAGLALAASTTAATAAAAPAAHVSIAGGWEGSYTCGQGLTGLDLWIQPPGKHGSLSATLNFYPLTSNPSVPVGSFTMRGTYHSASRIDLQYRRWILEPSGYFMFSLSGELSGSRFHGAVQIAPGGTACTTFSARKLTGRHSRTAVIGTWKGSYLGCGQGPTGLRLVVKPAGRTGNRLKATFNFYALASNPGVPTGSYTMTGFYFPGGVVLDQDHWISQPAGYSMVNLVGNPPHLSKWNGAIVGCTTFAVKR